VQLEIMPPIVNRPSDTRQGLLAMPGSFIDVQEKRAPELMALEQIHHQSDAMVPGMSG
jgi:hypothetical protein